MHPLQQGMLTCMLTCRHSEECSHASTGHAHMHAHMQAFINKQNRASERMLIEFFFQDFAPKYGLSDANLTFEQIKAMPEMLNYPADFTTQSVERYIAKLRKKWQDGDPRMISRFGSAFSNLSNLKPPPKLFKDMWSSMEDKAVTLQQNKYEREMQLVLVMKTKHELDMKRLGDLFVSC